MIWLPSYQDLGSPLFRIPLLLSCTTLTVLAQTPPPSPPVTREDTAKYGGKADVMGSQWVVQKSGYLYKTIYWGNVVCESAVVLAERLPGSRFAETVLPLLVRSPSYHEHNVRVTSGWLAGCMLMAFGGALRLWCYRTLGKFFTWRLVVMKDHALVTQGPYSIVRHPSYMGSLMLGAGAVLCHVAPGSWYRECIGWDTVGRKLFTAAWAGWSIMVPILLMMRVNKEDAVLRNEFGPEWEIYARKTPYKLIPFVY